ncbi:MAG: sigma 54-interacting transcriptional regulator [Selenomonadaceae bacterium]|nr:sigma 54-interacting transcriptional regulator [Selenomonadaceae bacterium]
MIRGPRSREKLKAYYESYMKTGRPDPNVNPEVAASWAKSRAYGAPTDRIHTDHRLSREDFAARQRLHKEAISYLRHLTNNLRDFFKEYDISLLLLDEECVILKSYTMPFYQMTPGEIEGVRVGVEEIGTSSVSMAYDLQQPFWLFGPEMWVQDSHESDACSAPIFVDKKMRYIITMVGMHYQNMPQEAVMAVLKTLCYGLENYIQQQTRLKAQEAILDVIPFAVYHVQEGSEVAYANKLGMQRLKKIGIGRKDNKSFGTKLSDVVLNYRHTPIYSGFQGVLSHNREVTWITPSKTYEDITTVVPFERDSEDAVRSVVAISMPIEDLRTMVAHAAGFTAKYSLSSMVCASAAFSSVKEKALRLAKGRTHILLQGESGTGKQRMAHGIHQASPFATGPFIALHCGDVTPELLEQEIFGVSISREVSHPGKLELASGGTLFIDEIEKMPTDIVRALAASLTTMESSRIGEETSRPINVRLVAACDTELRRLTERGSFDKSLYEVLSHSVIRIPPLRNRKEDIGVLGEHILSELAGLHQSSAKALAPDAVDFLMTYEWPGNIKQLQNVIEHAFFRTEGEVIHAEDINLFGDITLDARWKEDKEVFIKVWRVAGGNISRLSTLLHVSRVTLYRYLKKYGIEKSKIDS